MNENIALILSLLVIAASGGTVLFYKNKYNKQAPIAPVLVNNMDEIELLKQEYLQKEINYSEKIKNLELEQAVVIEEKRIALENNKTAIQRIAEQEKIIEEKSVPIESITVIEDPKIEEKIIKSILVVDDSVVVRNKMKKLLEGAGYQITTANDGIEALHALDTLPSEFDLVITDLEMPNLDGFGLIAKMHKNPETKNLPIMAITGHEEMKIRISECEALYSIQKKPWKDSDVLKKVKILSNMNN